MGSYVKMERVWEENRFYSHVKMGRFCGKFNLSRGSINEFWDNYKTSDHGCLAERQFDWASMLVVDVDHKEKHDNLKHLYDNKEIYDVIESYITAIRNHTSYLEQNTNLDVVVLTKDPYWKNNATVSHGYHLAFVDIFANKKLRKIIRETAQTHSDVEFDNIEGKPWLMYGCSKKDESRNAPRLSAQASLASGSYKAQYVVRYTEGLSRSRSEISIEEWLSGYTLYDTSEKKIKPTLERALSIFPMGRKETHRCDKRGVNISMELREENKEYPEMSDIETYNQCYRLLDKISSARADNRNDWLAIGGALHNACGGSEEGLNLWIGFSEQSNKFVSGECERLWEGFIDKFTIGTLFYYAKCDRPRRPQGRAGRYKNNR